MEKGAGTWAGSQRVLLGGMWVWQSIRDSCLPWRAPGGPQRWPRPCRHSTAFQSTDLQRPPGFLPAEGEGRGGKEDRKIRLKGRSLSEAEDPPRLGLWSLYITYQVWDTSDLELVLTLSLVPWKILGNSLPSSGSVSSSMEQEWSQLPLRDYLKGSNAFLCITDAERSDLWGAFMCCPEAESGLSPQPLWLSGTNGSLDCRT